MNNETRTKIMVYSLAEAYHSPAGEKDAQDWVVTKRPAKPARLASKTPPSGQKRLYAEAAAYQFQGETRRVCLELEL